MALAHVATSAWVTSATTVTPTMPTGTVAGHLVVITLVSKYADAAIAATPVGWTDVAAAVTNTGSTSGNDAGNMIARAFWKIWQDGDTMPALAPLPNNVSTAKATTYSISAGSIFDISGVLAAANQTATPWVLAAGSTLGIKAGDIFHADIVMNGDVITFGASTPTATGATFGTMTNNIADAATATGTDLEMRSARWAPTGTATGNVQISQAITGGTTNTRAIGLLLRVRESAPSVTTVSASDTSSVTLAETAEITVSRAASDSGLIILSESFISNLFIAAADSGAVSVAEGRALLVDAAVFGTDASGIVLTEQQAQAVSSQTSDSASLSISEMGQNTVAISATDSGAISASDNHSGFFTIAGTDSTTLAALETTTQHINASLTDSDASGLVVIESANSFWAAPGADFGSLGVIEASDIVVYGTIEKEVSDSVALGLIEQQATLVALTGTENISLSVNEVTESFRAIQVADASGLSVAETSSGFNVASEPDASVLTISEVSAVYVNAFISASDTGALVATESAGIFWDAPGADQLALGVEEAPSIVISGRIDFEVFDTAQLSAYEGVNSTLSIEAEDASVVAVSESTATNRTISASDNSTLFMIEGVGQASTLGSADYSSLSASESVGFAAVARTASDSGGLSASESHSLIFNLDSVGSDQAAISVSELSNIIESGVFTKSSADTGAIAVSETASPLVRVNRDDQATIALAEVSSFGAISFATTDTMSIGLTESIMFAPVTFGSTDAVQIVIVEATAQVLEKKTLYAYDTSSLTLSELSEHRINEGFVLIGADDSLAIRFSDHSRNWILGQTPIPIVFASNTESGTIIRGTRVQGDTFMESYSEEVPDSTKVVGTGNRGDTFISSSTERITRLA